MAANYNLSVDRNETYARQFQLRDGTGTPFDLLTEWNAAADVKVNVTDVVPACSFTVEKLSGGFLNLKLASGVTSAFTGACYFWDLRLTRISDSYTTYVLRGKLTVARSVTV